MAKVMIVDDAGFMRNILKNIVTEAGFEVVCEAKDGLQAINLYAQHHPDLVTMDVTMPEMDGLEAVMTILKVYPDAKFIMCSALGQQNTVLDSIRAGAKDFIVKPFDRDRVIESMLSVLNNH
jgi:two-component system, chemotaxis family, chemotaxis protein CheY